MQALLRTKSLLRKAQKLADLIESNEELDTAERDLMLAYLRDLHDIFAADSLHLVQPPPPQAAFIPDELPKRNEVAPSVADPLPEAAFVQNMDSEETIKDDAPVTNATKNSENTWDSLINAAEAFLERNIPVVNLPNINIGTSDSKNKDKNDELPPLTPIAESVPKTLTPIKNYVSDNHDDDATPVVVINSKTIASEPEIPAKTGVDAIFDIKASGGDVGADKPIKDFRMAFGINERIFNINELFGGSASVYDAVLNELNAMSTFDDARNFLQEKVVIEYAWAKPERIKKAQWFVRLLWRRFL
jgi:hypothetical protein